jgi:hypothetical protein
MRTMEAPTIITRTTESPTVITRTLELPTIITRIMSIEELRHHCYRCLTACFTN